MWSWFKPAWRGGRPLVGVLVLLQLVAAAGATEPAPHLQAPRRTDSQRPAPPQPPPEGPILSSTSVIPAGRQLIRLPILMYHYIRVNPDPHDRIGFGLSVEPSSFAAQMDWLDANGYTPIDLQDLRIYLEGQADLPRNPVVLTFDDGYKDLYSAAYPVLEAHHFKAVAYIVAGFLDNSASVTRSQVLEMASHGVEIASHTMNHLDLTALSPSRLEWELTQSKQQLEQLLGYPVLDFAYPSGRHNHAVEMAVQAAGYQTAVTTEPGVSHNWSGRFTWTRVRVAGGESLPEFIARLGVPEIPVAVPELEG